MSVLSPASIPQTLAITDKADIDSLIESLVFYMGRLYVAMNDRVGDFIISVPYQTGGVLSTGGTLKPIMQISFNFTITSNSQQIAVPIAVGSVPIDMYGSAFIDNTYYFLNYSVSSQANYIVAQFANNVITVSSVGFTGAPVLLVLKYV